MERLTIKSAALHEHYNLKCMCTICGDDTVDGEDGCSEYCELYDADCDTCEVQQAFDRLAAYENTGLSPEEIKKLQVANVLLQKQANLAHETILAIESEMGKAVERSQSNERYKP